MMAMMIMTMNKEKLKSLHFTHDAWEYGGEQNVGKEHRLIISVGID
jgi:hypothetical protein